VFRATFADDYDVRTAVTLEEARRALNEGPFDVVISDQVMPEISGTTFLREVARTHPQTIRVMLTGNACVGELIGEIGTGFVELFLPKPWSAAAMRQVFERARL